MTLPEAQVTAIERGNSAPAAAWTRRPRNLAGAVAAELVVRIVTGTYPPGGAIPPESALCTNFSVSRTVVREAVKMLQEKGLVQVRQGSGTVVSPPTMWNMLDKAVLGAFIAEADGLDVLDDLVVTRRLLESDMANVAARRADADVVQRLGQLVDRMDALRSDPVAYAIQDRAFHDLIMQTSGNRIARGVVRALESQVLSAVRYIGQPSQELCTASNLGHRRIYECIAAGDPQGAADATFTHITQSWILRRGGADGAARLRR